MDYLTQQQAFDKVLAHLRKQGLAAMSERDCRYRAEDGAMCAVGCLIPDDVYNPDYENNAVHYLPSDLLKASGINRADIDLYSDLQDAHDYELAEYGLDEWESRMNSIAIKYGLTYTPPQGD